MGRQERRTRQALRSRIWLLVLGAFLCVGLYEWEYFASNRGQIVVYFGRPSHLVAYLSAEGYSLVWKGAMCILVAATSLAISAILSTALLVFGLFSSRRLQVIERAGAYLQTVPMLVVVTIGLLLEKQILAALDVRPSAHWYCLLPVSFALMFPPLAYGAAAIDRAPLHLKELLRLWGASSFWRIRRVYLPLIIPDVLTGIRTSATWAVSATLIAEGLLNGVDGDSATLGHSLLRPFSAGQSGETLSVVLIATGLGYLLYALVVALQEAVGRWLHGPSSAAVVAYPLQAQ